MVWWFDVSEDGLTYTLKIKDVKVSDTGDDTISIGDLTATVTLFIERTDNNISQSSPAFQTLFCFSLKGGDFSTQLLLYFPPRRSEASFLHSYAKQHHFPSIVQMKTNGQHNESSLLALSWK